MDRTKWGKHKNFDDVVAAMTMFTLMTKAKGRPREIEKRRAPRPAGSRARDPKDVAIPNEADLVPDPVHDVFCHVGYGSQLKGDACMVPGTPLLKVMLKLCIFSFETLSHD